MKLTELSVSWLKIKDEIEPTILQKVEKKGHGNINDGSGKQARSKFSFIFICLINGSENWEHFNP